MSFATISKCVAGEILNFVNTQYLTINYDSWSARDSCLICISKFHRKIPSIPSTSDDYIQIVQFRRNDYFFFPKCWLCSYSICSSKCFISASFNCLQSGLAPYLDARFAISMSDSGVIFKLSIVTERPSRTLHA